MKVSLREEFKDREKSKYDGCFYFCCGRLLRRARSANLQKLRALSKSNKEGGHGEGRQFSKLERHFGGEVDLFNGSVLEDLFYFLFQKDKVRAPFE
jgi:hypothetical protein